MKSIQIDEAGLALWIMDRKAHVWGCEQDEESLLAEVDHLPLLIAFLDRDDGLLAKRQTLVHALVLMLSCHHDGEEGEGLSAEQVQRIEAALVRHRDVALSACGELGPDEEALLRRVLGA